jgi:hypothetical protein
VDIIEKHSVGIGNGLAPDERGGRPIGQIEPKTPKSVLCSLLPHLWGGVSPLGEAKTNFLRHRWLVAGPKDEQTRWWNYAVLIHEGHLVEGFIQAAETERSASSNPLIIWAFSADGSLSPIASLVSSIEASASSLKR